jgi:peptidoglycan biosynthesis protein MviN/MurJ (putative lipid II flippase)
MLQYIPMAGAAFLTGTNVLVDQSVASTVGAGNVAVLGYASRIIGVVLQVGIFAVSSVLLSHFSHLVATRDRTALHKAVRQQSLVAGGVGLAVTIALVLLSHPLVRLVFQRGQFSAADAELVGAVQSLYALQLVPHMMGIVWVRFLSAAGSNRPIMFISGVNLVANVVLDLALVGPFGVKGIALSTSIVYAGSAVMLWFTVSRRMAELP